LFWCLFLAIIFPPFSQSSRNWCDWCVIIISIDAFNPDSVYYMRCLLRFKNIERL